MIRLIMKRMNRMKILSLVIIGLGLSAGAWAETSQPELNGASFANSSVKTQKIKIDKKNPYEMIEKVARLTFDRFANEHNAIRANPNLLKIIVREELMPYINYKYSAYKVIGKNFKKTNEKDRAEFVKVFREYLITSYAQVFTLYNKQLVEFEPAKQIKPKTKILAVNTRVIEPGRKDINISFKVRKNKKTKEWKAFDMVAEGVSLLDSKQAELGSLIRQKGLPYVSELLKEKSQRNIVF